LSPAKTVEPIVMPLGILTRVGPRNHVLDGAQIRPCEEEILRAKRSRPTTCPVVDILRATQQGVESLRCGCQLGVVGEGAHWRNLASAIEPSICGGDAALCQITLK